VDERIVTNTYVGDIGDRIVRAGGKPPPPGKVFVQTKVTYSGHGGLSGDKSR